ncbi:tail fiber protein [Xenorhabdus khoisanae]|uniref:tail fiber protein n=1 Tax=Xenorhabdus khoisanae TaxID=880157 RepID=UPI0023591955|nr:tail fiber protein [Xenorhabdus khoisanae]MDC9614008.1 tail fiber protein [Xenorhabdus khoisanae]
MKEIRYSAKIQEQQTLSNAKGVGPETDKLKDKFKDGSIPLQIDFNQLIDIADVGRKACGQAPDQNGPGTGLKLNNDGTLSLKMGTIDNQNFSPLILEKDILSVDLGSGLTNKTNGICVGEGDGIKVNQNNVAVKLADKRGIIFDANGIAIRPGDGMQFSSDGALEAKPADSTITVDSSGIKVKTGSGLKSNDDHLYVSLRKTGALAFDENSNIYVKTGNGIKLDNDQVVIDPNTVLPRGMIVMFSGSTVPQGWALCDGNNDTPNLIDRFILGGKINDINSKNNATLSGSGSNKTYNKTTDDKTISVDVKINDTILTEAQIPSHKHIGGMAYVNDNGFRFKFDKDSDSKNNNTQLDNKNSKGFCSDILGVNRNIFATDTINPYYPYTSDTGNGEGHSHNTNVTVGPHNHSMNVIPPYYILAFIIKL